MARDYPLESGNGLEAILLRDRAVHASSDGIIITDPRRADNPIVYANPGVARLTGYRVDEIVGRNCRFLQGPETDMAAISELRQGIVDGRDARVTLLNYRKDGTPFWNQLSITPVLDEGGDITNFIGVQMDVTERVRAEEALRLKERAVSFARSGIIITDARLPDNPIIYANEAFERLTGYPREETIGRNCRFLQGPETDPQTRDRLRDAVVNARDCLVVIRNYRRDGTPFWNELSVSPVFDARGRPSHFIGVQNDITDFRRTEEENARLLSEVQNAAAQQRAFLRDILRSVTEGRLRLCESESDLPEPLAPVGTAVPLTLDSLRMLRRTAVEAAQRAGLSDERWQDFVAGVGEAAMNAVVHAGGGEAEVRASGETGEVQVWIRDHGHGIAIDNLHLATLERGYSSAGTMGHGFWLMLKVCDACWLLTGPAGTTVVLQQGQVAPRPPWLAQLD